MAVFAGYSKNFNAHKVYIPESNTITTSGDVYFPKEENIGGLLIDKEDIEDMPDPLTSVTIAEGSTMVDVNESGMITDFKLWLPCAVKCMEHF